MRFVAPLIRGWGQPRCESVCIFCPGRWRSREMPMLLFWASHRFSSQNPSLQMKIIVVILCRCLAPCKQAAGVPQSILWAGYLKAVDYFQNDMELYICIMYICMLASPLAINHSVRVVILVDVINSCLSQKHVYQNKTGNRTTTKKNRILIATKIESLCTLEIILYLPRFQILILRTQHNKSEELWIHLIFKQPTYFWLTYFWISSQLKCSYINIHQN